MAAEEVDLKQQVATLAEQLKKTQKVLSQTGQQVMSLQLSQRSTGINEIGDKTRELQAAAGLPQENKQSSISGDYVGMNDLQDMTVELSGQLQILDERNIRRIANSHRTEPDQCIAPLPDSVGEFPRKFPKTVHEFASLEWPEVIQLCQYYEIVPEDIGADSFLKDEQGNPRDPSDPLLTELFDSLARFMGLRARRTDGVW